MQYIKTIYYYVEKIKCHCRDNECNCFIFKSIVRRRNRKKCLYCNSCDSFASAYSND